MLAEPCVLLALSALLQEVEETMKIVAVQCKPSDLKPGDLFSSVGPSFWDQAHLGVGNKGPGAIGVKTYIRTEVPFDPMGGDAEAVVYRLHIIPTKVEQLLSEKALRAIIETDDADPIEPMEGQLKLEVVKDAEDLEPE